MDQPKKSKTAAKPCKSSEEVLERQRKCLVDVVNEARKNEEKRVKKLDLVRKEDKESLKKRFDIERICDQEKVNNLVNDYEQLKKNVSAGNYPQMVQRNTIPDPNKKLNMTANRWIGLENHVDTIFHRSIVGMFDKHDSEFRKKMGGSSKFNVAAEKQKLNLLYERKNIISQLVKVQRNEIVAAGGYVPPMNSGRSSSYASSVSSGSHQSSNASYATFASKPSSAKITISRGNNKVPSLALNNLHKEGF